MENIPLIRPGDTKGRTPSWIATMAPSGTLSRAFLTEWKRVNPPCTSSCGHEKSATKQYSFQYEICSFGRTVITRMSGSAATKASIVLLRTGLPPRSRNCFGVTEPIRVPLPAAIAINNLFPLAIIILANITFFVYLQVVIKTWILWHFRF